MVKHDSTLKATPFARTSDAIAATATNPQFICARSARQLSASAIVLSAFTQAKS